MTATRTTTVGEEVGDTPHDDEVRAGTYGLLGALLAAPPGADLLALLARVDPLGDGGRDTALGPAWEALRLAGERATVESLDDEYHDLFIGLGRGELVPYGSWYLTGFMMDKPLALLRHDLRLLGFERRDEVKEPEDHAAALLETMALIIREGEAPATQRRFFDHHVAPWMGRFFADLQAARSARFYRSVGQLGEGFIGFERGYLGMLV